MSNQRPTDFFDPSSGDHRYLKHTQPSFPGPYITGTGKQLATLDTIQSVPFRGKYPQPHTSAPIDYRHYLSADSVPPKARMGMPPGQVPGADWRNPPFPPINARPMEDQRRPRLESESSVPPKKKARGSVDISRTNSDHATSRGAGETSHYRGNKGQSSGQATPKSKGKRGKSKSRPQEDEDEEEAAESPAKRDGDSEHPTVLTREKKQKACANCRRAKLKCMVDDGESECVRCKARKEKCVFYPRNHDDDWQQIVTTDVYSAIAHLTNLSSAVQHTLHHLTAQGLIPPFETANQEPLEEYQAPDRDVSMLQGWGMDANRDLPSSKRKGVKPRGDDTKSNGESAAQKLEHRPESPKFRNESSSSRALPSPSGPAFPISEPWRLPPVEPGRQQTTYWDPSPSSNQMNNWDLPPVSLPPNQNSYDRQRYPPSSSGDMNRREGFVPLDASRMSFTHPTQPLRSPPIPLRNDPNGQGSTSVGPMTLGAMGMTFAPEIQPNTTPGSLPHSSPSISNQGGIRSMLYPPLHEPMPVQMQPPKPPIQEPEQGLSGPLVPYDVVPGCDDSRQDVITKGIVEARDAVTLLNYSHQHLGRLLYGYRLEFGRFPYLANGPTTITPLILAVMCLLGSERIANLSHYHPALNQAVQTLLLESPAESWQSVTASTGQPTGEPKEEDELDPELGIGPEEIVGAAVLSMWITERQSASWIADVAFKWARGWIKLLSGPPRNSIAEIAGIVPAERVASRPEMARVWLLCYITDGTEAVLHGDSVDTGRDPDMYCRMLVPEPLPHPPPADVEPHDIILTLHARMLYLLREWLNRRCLIVEQPSAEIRAKEIQRLTSRVDGRINALRDSIDPNVIPDIWPSAKQLDLFGLFARATIHNMVIRMDLPSRQKGASLGILMDVGMEMLEKWARWSPKEEITNMPQPFLSMIIVIAHTVYDNIVFSIQNRGIGGVAISPADAWPLFQDLGDKLHLGGLPPQHPARSAAESCLKKAADLRRMAGQ